MADGDLKKQIEIGADVSGIDTGVAAGKKKLSSLGDHATRVGKQTQDAIADIGKGGDKASAKVDSATKSIIQSIQRTTAIMEAGSRTSAKYFEVLASQRGADVNALRPYLAQLDEVQKKQALATQAITVSQPAMQQLGVSAKATAAAMRGVPAQFTDIVTSLQAGQNPISVFLQQGGQLKDMFGGIGPAARALGGYVAGLVTPFTVAAAAAGVLALAYFQGSKEADGYTRAIALTGNAAGATVSQYQGAAEAIARLVGTQSAAAQVVAELGSTGKVAASNLARFGEVALRLERDAGVPIKETVKALEELGKSPVDASLKLNERLNYLTRAVYEQIRALEEQGRTTQAAALAQKAYTDALDVAARQVESNAGSIERAWRGITSVAKEAWDAMLGVGRKQTIQQQLADVAGELAAVRGEDRNRRFRLPWQESEQSLLARQAALQEMARLERRGAEAAAERTRAEQAGIEFSKLLYDTRTKQQKAEAEIAKARELGLAAGRSELEIQQAIAAIREKYKESGAAGTGQNEVAAIRARIKEEEELLARLRDRGAQARDLTEGEKLVLKIQEELKTSITGVARAQKEKALAAAQELASVQLTRTALEQQAEAVKKAQAEYDKLVQATGDAASRILDQARGQEAANATFGKSKTAIEEMTLAQLRHNLAEAEASDRFTPQYIAALNSKVQAQERFVDALKQSELKQLQLANTDWARATRDEAETLDLQVRLLGVSQVEREKIIAQRRVELELARRLREIDESSVSDADKEAQRAEARKTAILAADNATRRVIVEDWDRTSQQISDSFVDNLMRGGKSVVQYLKDLFRTTVLKPVLQPIGNLVGGVVNSITQPIVSSLVQSVTGSLGNVLGLGSSLGSQLGFPSAGDFVLSLLGGGSGIGGAAITSAEIAGTVAATESALAGMGAAAGEATAAAAALGESMAASAGALSSISSALAAVPGWGWAAMAAVALFGGGAFKGETRAGGAYEYTAATGAAQFLRGPSGGDPMGQQVASLINANVAGLNNALAAFGLDTRVTEFHGAYESSGKGRGGVYAGGTLSTGATFGESGQGSNYAGTLFEKTSTQSPGTEEAFQNFVTDSYQAAVQALQEVSGMNAGKAWRDVITEQQYYGGEGFDGWMVYQQVEQQLVDTFDAAAKAAAEEASGVPKIIRDMIRGVDAESLSAQASQALVERINAVVTSVQGFRAAMEALPFQRLRDLSFDAAATLIQMSGGLEQLTTNLGAYYQNFFSEGEKQRNVAQQISEALAAGGLAFTADQILEMTRAQFRSLVESTSPDTQQYAALIAVNQAFASIVPEAESAARSIREVSASLEALEADKASLQVELKRAQGDEAGADVLQRALDTAGMTAAEIALYDYNAALRKQIDAVKEARAAWSGLTDSIVGEVQRLRSQMGEDDPRALAQLQSQFAIATARARAGDQTAAGELPALSQAIERLAETNAVSQVDADFIRAQLAGSLSQTAALLAAQYGVQASALASVTVPASQAPVQPVQQFSAPLFGAIPTLRVETANLEQRLVEIKQQLDSMRQQLLEANGQLVRTANAVNGAPEAPVPVEIIEEIQA